MSSRDRTARLFEGLETLRAIAESMPDADRRRALEGVERVARLAREALAALDRRDEREVRRLARELDSEHAELVALFVQRSGDPS